MRSRALSRVGLVTLLVAGGILGGQSAASAASSTKCFNGWGAWTGSSYQCSGTAWDGRPPLYGPDSSEAADIAYTEYAAFGNVFANGDLSLYFSATVFDPSAELFGGPATFQPQGDGWRFGYRNDPNLTLTPPLQDICFGGLDTDYAKPGPEYSVCTTSRTGELNGNSYSIGEVTPNRPGLGSGGEFLVGCCSRYVDYFTQPSNFAGNAGVTVLWGAVTLTGPASSYWSPVDIPGQLTSVRWTAVSGTDFAPSEAASIFVPLDSKHSSAPAGRSAVRRATGLQPPPSAQEILAEAQPATGPPKDDVGPKVGAEPKAPVKGKKATLSILCPKSEKPAGCANVELASKGLKKLPAGLYVAAGDTKSVKAKVAPGLLDDLKDGRSAVAKVTLSGSDDIGNIGTNKLSIRLTG